MHPALRNASRDERYSPKSKNPVTENDGDASSRTILFRNNNYMVFVDRGDVRGDLVGVTEVFYSRPQNSTTWSATAMIFDEEDHQIDSYDSHLRGLYSNTLTDQVRSRSQRALINAELITVWSQIYKNLHAWADGKKFGEEKPKRFPMHLKDLRVGTHWLSPSIPKPVIDCYEESPKAIADMRGVTFLDITLIPNSLIGWKYSKENPYIHDQVHN